MYYQAGTFYNYNCSNPYDGLSKVQVKIDAFVTKISSLQSEAVLFEVTVPTFPLVMTCKKENKLLKELWDYIYLVLWFSLHLDWLSCITGENEYGPVADHKMGGY